MIDLQGLKAIEVFPCAAIHMGCEDHGSFLLVTLPPSTHGPHDDHNWLIQANGGGRHTGRGPGGFAG